MKIIEVVAAIIVDRQNRILIARRKPYKILGGKWEFPGGKVEFPEDHQSALQREILEELGVKIEVIGFVGSNLHQYETIFVNLFGYKAQYLSGTFKLTDHDQIAWVGIKELKDYEMAPADIPLIEII